LSFAPDPYYPTSHFQLQLIFEPAIAGVGKPERLKLDGHESVSHETL